MSADQPIRILHLSDIHFRVSKKWDADPVLRELANFIKREVESGLKPDLVAITGDLAHAGIAEEYKLAKEWLENYLWPAVGNLPRDRLLLVPGNHDVDRSKVGRMAKLSQDGLLTVGSQAAVGEVLSSGNDRSIMLDRHSAYIHFLTEWLGKPQVLPWWQSDIEINGCRLHIAGLDSAWMAHKDKERGDLLLGVYQLTQTVMHEKAGQAEWRLALVHHPWDYLAEFDTHEARAIIHRHCDLLLRGHLHVPLSARTLPPDPNRGCLELAAGCVYEKSQYSNAFQWIELLPGKRVRVLFRAWLHNDWTEDRNYPGCPFGWAEYDLAAPAKPARNRQRNWGRTANSVIPAAVIPAEYLAWLQRAFADVSLLGQEVQKGQAITLSQVHVPALTRSAAMPEVAALGKARARPAAEERQAVPLLQRLDAESLYVPAPAGAGKSTFCRWAVLQSIAAAPIGHAVTAPDEFAEPEPKSLRGRLPLLVPLRDFGTDMDCGRGGRTWHRGDLEDALATWAGRLEGLSAGTVKAHLKAGSAFVLLDGLDEVPVSDTREGATVYPRELLLSGLADALPDWLRAGNRILLTSRPYGLDEAGLHRLGLPSAPLEPLPKAMQDLFVSRWFHTLGRPGKIEDLIATIRDREDLAPLVENPMLLTALCVLYDSGGRLPEDRYELYKRIVNNVLFHRYPGDAKQREPVLRRLESIALGMHVGDSESTRQSPAAETSWVEVEQWLARFAELNPAYERGSVEPVAQREELLTRSGLLLPRANDRAAFYHLSIQEYLAAERILRLEDDLWPIFLERSAVAEWRATLMFLFAGKIACKSPRWGTDLLQRLLNEQERSAVEANPWPAAFIAEALELCLAKDYSVPEILKEGFRRLALDAIVDEVALQARHALGLCLGRVGDPRIPSLRDRAAYVEVAAGTYPCGEEGEKAEIEAPFLLGKYPVTNSQYQAFMDAGGYAKPEYWSEAGWAWRQKEGVTEPRAWRDRRWNGPNQPVVAVSFWEAEACCRWAGGRLPTEREWEAAARGPEGLAYPWGNEWEDGICNSDEAGLGVTSAVALFPRSRQAGLGIEDLAGNVFEWCDSFFDPKVIAKPGASRVLRGGCSIDTSWFLRASLRFPGRPEVGGEGGGFRCVLAPPRQPVIS
ncbi:MAG: SUMF1/EgtB/PvdO family nonheme iron enzyme [Rhodospirillales bacterium]|nr:SUMF1/EgtB/PvdO family nonheme iron enzyme [Rhodospirillales bacterium]